MQVAVGDRGDLGADLLHRPQRVAGDPPGHEGDGGQQQGHADDEGGGGGVVGRVHLPQRGAGVDGGHAVRGVRDDLDDPLTVLAVERADVPGVKAGPRRPRSGRREGGHAGQVRAGEQDAPVGAHHLDELDPAGRQTGAAQFPGGGELGHGLGLPPRVVLRVTEQVGLQQSEQRE